MSHGAWLNALLRTAIAEAHRSGCTEPNGDAARDFVLGYLGGAAGISSEEMLALRRQPARELPGPVVLPAIGEEP